MKKKLPKSTRKQGQKKHRLFNSFTLSWIRSFFDFGVSLGNKSQMTQATKYKENDSNSHGTKLQKNERGM